MQSSETDTFTSQPPRLLSTQRDLPACDWEGSAASWSHFGGHRESTLSRCRRQIRWARREVRVADGSLVRQRWPAARRTLAAWLPLTDAEAAHAAQHGNWERRTPCRGVRDNGSSTRCPELDRQDPTDRSVQSECSTSELQRAVLCSDQFAANPMPPGHKKRHRWSLEIRVIWLTTCQSSSWWRRATKLC